MKPIIQVALDFIELKRAVKLAHEAVGGGADWLEAGTLLIKSEGMDAVRTLRKEFPNYTIIADMKIADTGRAEVEVAAKSGADIVCVLGGISDSTIKECIEAGRNYGAKIMVDLLEVEDLVKRAKQVESWGADYLCIHTPIDAQMRGKDPFKDLGKISKAVNIPIAVAGGINSETASKAVQAGASIIIVGGAITKSENAKEATRIIKKSIKDKKPVKTSLYKRISGEDIKDIFFKVSTSNISDALHRGGYCRDIRPILENIKLVGKVFTVRTYPGDWAKPVEAIDKAEKGDVIVIDCGGVGPAVWGELASWSAKQKGIAGVVIDGAIRDVPEIKKFKFSAFAKIITPQAGEPKGFGEIGVGVEVGTVKVFPGDWIIGDDDGVVVVPQLKATEIANRAMDVLEKENRVRKEIKEGSTLSQVTELLRWEKNRRT
ncbi:MAG: DUF561 domain-containing protein [Candidatus Omnitrophica bacterium]|nr:DUF561 domain-containing protein [Candidatus Omnitrophota bacterium]MBU1048032.1 DUF561 domain-containing protein [Candidatus Omnitrophota bacterium]MBU1631257.1 DUF561 domain-containing protein [Candidatus Omnitrophota bacterium]MBU1767072.1 DUF561 domain-containing protein [Candidatus Omnitrophota bacterium]MBU1889402.1 DUF561 domain-containing protein [Candidatus Omnitrophota bacterium]